MNTDIILTLGGAVIGAAVGSYATYRWLDQKYIDATMELFDEMKLTDQQYNVVMGYATPDETSEPQQSIIHIRVEEVNGVKYVYNKETNEFIVQGTSAEEVKALLSKKVPQGVGVSCLVEDGRNYIS